MSNFIIPEIVAGAMFVFMAVLMGCTIVTNMAEARRSASKDNEQASD